MKRVLAGFSIIEMLLVVGLIAIISSFLIMGASHHKSQQQIKTIALEYQGILQAAMDYFVENKDWPAADTSSCLSASAQFGDATTFINQYLPNKQTSSRWGNQFCWSPDTDSGGAVVSPRFWVALKMPGNPSQAYQRARRLVALLPNAIALENPETTGQVCTDTSASCFVRVEVVKPAQSNWHVSGWNIQGFGQCLPDQTHSAFQPSTASCTGSTADDSGATVDHYTVNFACEPSHQPYIMAVPGQLLLGATNEENDPADGELQRLQANASSCENFDNGQCQCSFNVDMIGYMHSSYASNPVPYSSPLSMRDFPITSVGGIGKAGAVYQVMTSPINAQAAAMPLSDLGTRY